MSEPYKTILPRDGRAEAREVLAAASAVTLPKRRPSTRVACNTCRKRKVAPIRHELNKHHEFINKLKYLPDGEAQDLLQRLRSTTASSSLIHDLCGGMDGRQRPSDIEAALAMSVPTDSRLEFELIARHRMAYPSSTPAEATPVRLSQASESILNQQALLHGTRVPAPIGPLQVNLYCDNRLKNLRMEYWTGVPITNEYAAAVISFYLQTDHSFVGLFDADLFLTDLTEKRNVFCSPFLVTSLMYLACQPYTAVDIQAAIFKLAFFAEAEDYLEKERSSATLVNVAAITALSMGCIYHGKDALGNELIVEARDMAMELGLFGDHDDGTSSNTTSFRQMGLDWIRAASHIAWGLYGWLGHPPTLPIPGQTPPKRDESWPAHPLPAYMGNTFPSVCELFVIFQQVCVAYSSDEARGLPSEKLLRIAESKYQELLHWADTLSLDMTRVNHCPTHVMIFHLFYHCVVLHIFRPFTSGSKSETTQTNHRLTSFLSIDSSANSVSSASINQLKHTISDYYFLYPQELHTVIFNAGVVQLADASLKDQDDVNWRLYFFLCVRCWQELYVSYPIFSDILHAYLSMALRNGMLTTREAETISSELKRRGSHHTDARKSTTNFLADFDLALSQPEEAAAHALAQRFGELGLFVELTEGDYIAPDPVKADS
ncbi:uncharacterized protein B0J16DRAFT_310981 [Fusarium flagelliforme]|uniref:uncharacterized protein n=1 Tax=Fusarium flagelliforme TaxID=2675880 RepID=UPI001E8EE0C4|nr:uncharacterized protein B0J16DRAFT_310981 [Fusarium flagelliforme]KAH7173245.1 hypothetical protein B0J16DRAFT_310981 [Fusarium flagelliforme]